MINEKYKYSDLTGRIIGYEMAVWTMIFLIKMIHVIENEKYKYSDLTGRIIGYAMAFWI
jgi:hypothetical protein